MAAAPRWEAREASPADATRARRAATATGTATVPETAIATRPTARARTESAAGAPGGTTATGTATGATATGTWVGHREGRTTSAGAAEGASATGGTGGTTGGTGGTTGGTGGTATATTETETLRRTGGRARATKGGASEPHRLSFFVDAHSRLVGGSFAAAFVNCLQLLFHSSRSCDPPVIATLPFCPVYWTLMISLPLVLRLAAQATSTEPTVSRSPKNR